MPSKSASKAITRSKVNYCTIFTTNFTVYYNVASDFYLLGYNNQKPNSDKIVPFLLTIIPLDLALIIRLPTPVVRD